MTKDLDLWMRENEESAANDLIRASLADLQDYFNFSIERTGGVDIDHEEAAVRYRLRAEVAGRQFEIVVVDVGFIGTLDREPELLPGPRHLAFADIATIQVPVLPLDFHVAEKLHAYTRRYAGAVSSSRVKDLIDLVLISSFTEFGAGGLRHALEITFTTRGSHSLPPLLPFPPQEWATAYQKLAKDVGLDIDVMTGHQTAARFLDPVLTGGARDNSRWYPARLEWSKVEDEFIDPAEFQLDDEAFSRFSETLDSPAMPSQELSELLSRKAPWE